MLLDLISLLRVFCLLIGVSCVVIADIFELFVEFFKRVSGANMLDLSRSRAALVLVNIKKVLGLNLNLI